MDKELVKSMFLKARDQYESAFRWAFLAVTIGAIFHLLTFSQFVSLNKRLAIVQQSVDDLGQLESTLGTTASRLERSQSQIEAALEQRIEATVESMASDFEALATTVSQIRTPTSAEVSPFDPDSLLLEGSQTVFQQPPTSELPPQRVFFLEESLENAIRAAAPGEQLQQVLIPVIEERIIQPRFDSLNEFWQDEILADLQETIAQATLSLAENQGLFPAGPAEAEVLISNLDQTLAYMQSIQFTPPSSDPLWWDSVVGKQATLDEMANAVISGFLETSSVDALKEVRDRVKDANEKQALLLEEIQTDLQNLEAQFKQQQARLEVLGKPFEFVSLDLAFLVSIFPLLLGALLAASIVWPAYRLRELAWAVDEMAQDEGGYALREWFSRRSGIRLADRTRLSAEVGTWRRTWVHNRAWLSTSLARVLFYCAWMGLAAWQLLGWGQIEAQRTIWFFLAGVILVLLAGIYQWYVAREIVLLNTPASTSQPAKPES